MSDTVIRVENLGKKYIIGHQKQERYTALRDVIANRSKGLFRRGRSQAEVTEEFWALKDVSFEIKQGDRIGIIGRNGAGKSTLLKILSRITEPTTGRIQIKGRVASLLEVGTGFHPELTGRENIFLNGAILGMSRAEIRLKFDEIVAFAEIEKFLDTPVKRYSSGMYVRLAFAVAAHLEPEILIVDEVLAVGDANFQKKCLGKMKDVADQGHTVMFVSHNIQAISTLTKTCIMLSQGSNIFAGPTHDAINCYLEQGKDNILPYIDVPSKTKPKITRVEVITSEPSSTQRHGEKIEFYIDFNTPRPIDGGALALQIVNSLQQPIIHLLVSHEEIPTLTGEGVFRLVCKIPALRLYLGRYSLNLHFSERGKSQKLQYIENICSFEVVAHGKQREGYWIPGTCMYTEDCEWEGRVLSATSM